MKLSIVIPAFNEEKTIADVLKSLLSIKLDGIIKEIIVVNDGSTDTSESIISKIKHQTLNIKSITHKKNMGKGAAVKTGIQHATGDYILIQDADLEYSPNDIAKLLLPVQKKQAIVVYGTRLKRLPDFSRDERTLQFLIHYIGNKLLSLLTSVMYGQWITDMETGYKLIPRDILQSISIHAKSFDFEPEITAKLLKRHIVILEIPITTNPRGYDQGKKLHTIRDGLIAFWTLLKYRFVD